MKSFRIISKVGQNMGTYSGNTEAEALLSLHRSAGYGEGRVWLEDGMLEFDSEETLDLLGDVDAWTFQEEAASL